MATLVPDRTIRNPAIGDVVTFLETATESGGVRTLIEIELAAHGGNALHRHLGYDEHFEVVEGSLEIRLGRDRRTLVAGERATAPAGSPHCFSNPTAASVRFRVELRPGHSGFEQSLRIAYGLAEDGLVRSGGIPRSLSHTAMLASMGDTRPAGPLAALGPLFGLIARHGRRKGAERELILRYC